VVVEVKKVISMVDMDITMFPAASVVMSIVEVEVEVGMEEAVEVVVAMVMLMLMSMMFWRESLADGKVESEDD
jgi:hypothetical protein